MIPSKARDVRIKRTAARSSLCAVILLTLGAARSRAAVSGTEGASFLDIPVGGRPAALGGAYTALASDAYAPVYNAGGLAFVPTAQLSGMHLDFAGMGGYEFVSFVHPFGALDGLGVSAQYFHADVTNALDANANPIGSVSSHYGAYSLAYGHGVTENFSLGAALKVIDARIADVSASAVAGDAGALYRVNERLTLAAAAANLGGRLKFLQQGDRLPEEYRAGILYSPLPSLSLVTDAAYDRTGLFSGRFGAEWRPVGMIALRAGYRTQTTQQLSPIAGLTTGVGLQVFGQRFDYAWVPLGDLGQTQYFSIVLTFGKRHGA